MPEIEYARVEVRFAGGHTRTIELTPAPREPIEGRLILNHDAAEVGGGPYVQMVPTGIIHADIALKGRVAHADQTAEPTVSPAVPDEVYDAAWAAYYEAGCLTSAAVKAAAEAAFAAGRASIAGGARG